MTQDQSGGENPKWVWWVAGCAVLITIVLVGIAVIPRAPPTEIPTAPIEAQALGQVEPPAAPSVVAATMPAPVAPVAAMDTPTASATPYVSQSTSGGDGVVHVRGYTKKDGTYVAPYTRSTPHRW